MTKKGNNILMALNDKVKALLATRGHSLKIFVLSGSIMEQSVDDASPVLSAWNEAVLGPTPTTADGFTKEELARLQVVEALVPTDQLSEATREQAFEGDPDRTVLAERLRNATPAQLKAYIQSNVTDLASAKLMLARMALVMATLARR